MAESKEFQGILNLAKGFPDFLFQVCSLEDFQNLKVIPSFFWCRKQKNPGFTVQQIAFSILVLL